MREAPAIIEFINEKLEHVEYGLQARGYNCLENGCLTKA